MNRIIFALLLFAFAFAGSAQETNRGKEFGIYLVVGSWDRRLMQGKGDWTNLTLLSEPLISEQEIVNYNWAEHRITLRTPDFLSRLQRVPVEGLPFVVMAGGEWIYLGAFMSPASSMSMAVPCILTYPHSNDTVTINRAYPSETFGVGPDPRGDARIKATLTRLGILDKPVDKSALAVKNESTFIARNLTVTINDVVRVERPGVGASVIQFVEFTAQSAKYRWRHKPRHRTPTSGSGEVTESFRAKPASLRETFRWDGRTADWTKVTFTFIQRWKRRK